MKKVVISCLICIALICSMTACNKAEKTDENSVSVTDENVKKVSYDKSKVTYCPNISLLSENTMDFVYS